MSAPDDRPYRGESLTTWVPHAEGIERAVIFEPGYNDRGGKYGVHGMQIRFVLRGPKGATQFLMSAGWVPGESNSSRVADLFPSAMDLGYHALAPQHEWQEQHGDYECEYVPGGRCWYDGSGLQAEPVMEAFIREGESAVWGALRDRYAELTTGDPS